MPTSLPTSGISIYAELLSNIRQVSVIASLPTASGPGTSAEIVENGTVVRISHGGHTESMALPAPVSLVTPLPIPNATAGHLSWRIPASDQVPSASSLSAASSLENQLLPWNAMDLQPASPIRCRKCGHDIVQKGTLTSWKDLPSENWAEMMEFWHCHKPLDHGAAKDDQHLTQRGYGASSTISAQPQVGFVDLTSFMLSESDCSHLSFSSSTLETGYDMSRLALDETQPPKFLHAYCRPCGSQVGLYNVLASSVSLFKWQVLCETRSPCTAPTSNQCLVAALASSISRSASSKSVIFPHEFSPSGDGTELQVALHLWVLNSNVTYVSSLAEGKKSAMKILFRSITVDEGNKLVDSITSDVQDISFPSSAIKTATNTLELSNTLLPARERSFKSWKVGLLER
ncbi:Pfam:DUF2351 [Geosmithia morbida]|uniref:Pfam:DUF2351 n=1 Tax=Geosmithia morbida TaxID=1094350 RepID=A0A9P4YUM4_9HYPO|nr:Pfam:DUF2351 [Geosmithia morbida]KAF4123413.1 Pfam:DUF2351 [Geosmithia morbida]